MSRRVESLAGRLSDEQRTLDEVRPGSAGVWDLAERDWSHANFIRVRHIMLQLGKDFAESQKDLEIYSVQRHDEDRTPPEPSNETKNKCRKAGVYSDFVGGSFSYGNEDRIRYLHSRLAAVEALSEIAGGIRAERIGDFFLLNRSLVRHPVQGTVSIRSNGQLHEAELVDICAFGLGLRIPNDVKMKAGTRFEILALMTHSESVDPWLPMKVQWTNGSRMGACMPQQDQEGFESEFIEAKKRNIRAPVLWVKMAQAGPAGL